MSTAGKEMGSGSDEDGRRRLARARFVLQFQNIYGCCRIRLALRPSTHVLQIGSDIACLNSESDSAHPHVTPARPCLSSSNVVAHVTHQRSHSTSFAVESLEGPDLGLRRLTRADMGAYLVGDGPKGGF